MISALAVGLTEVTARIDAKGPAAHSELKDGIGRLALKLNARVQRQKLSGQVLGVVTGRLRRSIHDTVIDQGDKIAGVVSTNVIYGVGWETGWEGIGGGSPKASLSAAKSKFSLGGGGGGDTFKNGTPKKRSFLASALQDMEKAGEIMSEFQAVAARIAK